MDHMQPINGISLELYAEIGAEISDFVNDQAKISEVIAARGIAQANWDAAVAGWTARMQDWSLMGAVATAYMPLYQAALARRAQSGEGAAAPDVSFGDYVNMSGAAKAMGVPAMCEHYGISQSQWTQIAGGWNQKIPTDPQYMMFGMQVEAEGARVGGGGAPGAVSFGGAGAAGPTEPAPPPPEAISSEFAVGDQVLVKWSDGNQYPGQITQLGQGQHQVTFPNGRQDLVLAEYLTKA